MHRLDDFKSFFSFGIASLLVPLAYILRAVLENDTPLDPDQTPGAVDLVLGNEVLFSIGIAILFVFGLSISKWGANQLVKNKRIRNWILGSVNIEGYWHLRTEPQHGDEDRFLRSGIAYMSYKLDSREFKIETIRYVEDRKYVTQSEVGYVRTTGSTIRYLNFFKTTYPDPDGPSGFASGRFSYGDHFATQPQFFEAIIAVQDGTFIGGQYAQRIPDDEVEKYYKQHGNDWQKRFLHDKESADEEILNVEEKAAKATISARSKESQG